MGSPARSSMPSVLEWTLLVLAVLQIAGAQNCGDVKAEYKKQGCCNQPAQGFALNPFQDDYAFKLTDIPDTGPDGTGSDGWNWLQPEQTCFYPVSLEQFADGHRTYSWIPHDSPVMYSNQTCLRSPRRPRTAHLSTRSPTVPFYTERSPGLRTTTQMQLSYSERPLNGPTNQPFKRLWTRLTRLTRSSWIQEITAGWSSGMRFIASARQASV